MNRLQRDGPMFIFAGNIPLTNSTVTEMEQLNHLNVLEYYTYVTLSSILLIIGVPGNILTIIVLRQRDMKDAVFSTYIISLCVFNIFVLVWCVPRTLVKGTLQRDVYFTDPDFCTFYRVLCLLLVSSGYWHLILVSGVRLSYLLDKKKKLSCLYDSPVKTIVMMVFILTCIQTPMMLKWIQHKNDLGETVECYAPRNSPYAFIIIFLQTFITAVLLIIINVWIYYLHRNKKSGLSEGSHSTPKLRKRLLYLIVVSSGQYLLSLIPICIYPPNTYRFFDVNTVIGKHYASFGNNLCLLVMYLNNSTNFIVYCFFGRRFRMQFYKLMKRWTQCCPLFESRDSIGWETSTDAHLTHSSTGEAEDVPSLDHPREIKSLSKHDGMSESHKKPLDDDKRDRHLHQSCHDVSQGVVRFDAAATDNVDATSVDSAMPVKASTSLSIVTKRTDTLQTRKGLP